MIHILYGQDDFTVREELERIRSSIDDEMLPTNTTVFEAQASPQEIANACETIPFLGSHRLVIVYDLLKRFEPGGRADASRELGPWAELVERAPNLPPTTVLILVDGDVSPANPMLRALTPYAEAKQFRALRTPQLPNWVQRRSTDKGLRLSPQAVRLLIENYGGNLWSLNNELDKLSNYAPNRQIEEEDVRALMAPGEVNVFALVDAVVEGRTNAALQLLRRLVAFGMDGLHILALIIRQYRMLVIARDGRDEGVSDQELGRRLGVSSDFVFRKAIEQSELYTSAQLKSAYKRLLEADVAIKSGLQDEEMALELLIADLSRSRSAVRRPA